MRHLKGKKTICYSLILSGLKQNLVFLVKLTSQLSIQSKLVYHKVNPKVIWEILSSSFYVPPSEPIILLVTRQMVKGLEICRRGEHMVGSTEQEKASPLSRAPLRQKPTRAKGFRDWGEVGKCCFPEQGSCTKWMNTTALVKYTEAKDFPFADFWHY